MAKHPIVHFEGRDIPMTEWLELLRLRHKPGSAPLVAQPENGRWVTRDLFDPALDELAAGQEVNLHSRRRPQ
jgi:hypothetical protein